MFGLYVLGVLGVYLMISSFGLYLDSGNEWFFGEEGLEYIFDIFY